MPDPVDDDTQRLADLDFRVRQEHEQFVLYDRRRAEFELQATATTAAALTMSALLIAGQDKLAGLGHVVKYGTAATILALVCSMIFAGIARFASWQTPTWLGRDEKRPDIAAGSTLTVLRRADDLSAVELRQLALGHWNARANSAWRLSILKYTWLQRAALALIVPLLFLVTVAVALLV
jgi:hypothetical protein